MLDKCGGRTYNSAITTKHTSKTTERGLNMSEREERAGKAIVDAFKLLPDEKKEFLLGYAEGVKAATKQTETEKDDKDESK